MDITGNYNSNYDRIYHSLWHNRTVRAACKDIDASAGTSFNLVSLRMLVKLWARIAINQTDSQYTENDLTELMALFPELYTPEPDGKWSSFLQKLDDLNEGDFGWLLWKPSFHDPGNYHFLWGASSAARFWMCTSRRREWASMSPSATNGIGCRDPRRAWPAMPRACRRGSSKVFCKPFKLRM